MGEGWEHTESSRGKHGEGMCSYGVFWGSMVAYGVVGGENATVCCAMLSYDGYGVLWGPMVSYGRGWDSLGVL